MTQSAQSSPVSTRMVCRSRPFRCRMLGALLLAGSMLVGCKQAHVARLPDTLMRGDADSQITFWHELTNQPVTNNDAAFHGLLLYFDNTDETTSYDQRVQLLKNRKMLLPDFQQPAELAIQRGVLARALCQALRIRGGVTMRVLGPSERYSAKELQFIGLFPPGTAQQTFTGNEFVGIIGRIEDYQRGNPADKPASELPGNDAQTPSEPNPATSKNSNGG